MQATLVFLVALLLTFATVGVERADSPMTQKPSGTCPGFLTTSIAVDGKQVNYVVYVPPSYDPARPIPTIIFLHGKGECGTDGLKQIAVGLGPAVMRDADKWPFLIIFPQKQIEKSAWEECDAMVVAILDQSKKDFNVDSSRLYLTGLSQGGHGTWTIAARHPDLFAALAPICGWCEKSDAEKLVKVPIWCFHGEADDVVKIDNAREMCDYLKGVGSPVKFTAYPGVGHNSWDKAYCEEALYDWFLGHHR